MLILGFTSILNKDFKYIYGGTSHNHFPVVIFTGALVLQWIKKKKKSQHKNLYSGQLKPDVQT